MSEHEPPPGHRQHDDHEHGHDEHGHDEHGHREHGHDEHGHAHRGGLLGRLTELVAPHSHDVADSVDNALETSRLGIRALGVSLAGLALTAALQAVVVVFTGSVALLGDTLHNAADALTALPLALAFWLGRRPPTRRYTYGYGRAEDLAGVVVVLAITASSALAAYESVRRLIDPQPVDHLWAVALASLIGFAGNELVARYRILVGRRIGSAALVADGLHARTDGLTSLAVLVGAGGVAAGWQQADPAVGLLITVAIVVVLRSALRSVYRRLMDAVDPELVDRVERALAATPGVRAVGQVRLRWIGHQLRAECEVAVDHTLSVVAAHDIAEQAQHRLLHDVPRLTAALVHADPFAGADVDFHQVTGHHRPAQH